MASGCPTNGCSVYNTATAPKDSGFISVINIGISKPSTNPPCVSSGTIEPHRDGQRYLVYQPDNTGHIARTASGTIVRIGNGNAKDRNVNSVQQRSSQQNEMTVQQVKPPPSAHAWNNGHTTVDTTKVSRHTEHTQNGGLDRRSWPTGSNGQYVSNGRFHQSHASVSSRSSTGGGKKAVSGQRLYIVVCLLVVCIAIVLGVGLYFILYHAGLVN